MIENLALKIVVWQVKNKYILEKDSKLYIYAYGLLLGQIINFLVACLLAVLFNAYLTMIMYLLTFIPLRSYAGGHHADNYNKCMIISTIMLCIVCLFSRIIPENFIISVNIIAALSSGGFIFLFAPVEDHNKPLDLEERIRYKKFSRAIWIVETFAWIIFYCMNFRSISLSISLSHLSVAFLLWMGIIKIKYLDSVK